MERTTGAAMIEPERLPGTPENVIKIQILRDKMPDEICIERFWRGKACIVPEKRMYTPQLACHATTERPVPRYQTGCSICGEPWDNFYFTRGWMGPPNFCPRCGAKRIEEDA